MYEGRRSESKKPWLVSFGVYGFLLYLREGQFVTKHFLSFRVDVYEGRHKCYIMVTTL